MAHETGINEKRSFFVGEPNAGLPAPQEQESRHLSNLERESIVGRPVPEGLKTARMKAPEQDELHSRR